MKPAPVGSGMPIAILLALAVVAALGAAPLAAFCQRTAAQLLQAASYTELIR